MRAYWYPVLAIPLVLGGLMFAWPHLRSQPTSATTPESVRSAPTPRPDRPEGDEEDALPLGTAIEQETFLLRTDTTQQYARVQYARKGQETIVFPALCVTRVTLREAGGQQPRDLFDSDNRVDAASLGKIGEPVLEVRLVDLNDDKAFGPRLRAALKQHTGAHRVTRPRKMPNSVALTLWARDPNTNERRRLGSTTALVTGNPAKLVPFPLLKSDAEMLARCEASHLELSVESTYLSLLKTDDVQAEATTLVSIVARMAQDLRSREGKPALIISGGGGSLDAKRSLQRSLSIGSILRVYQREGTTLAPEVFERLLDALLAAKEQAVSLAGHKDDETVALALAGLPPLTAPLGTVRGYNQMDRKEQERVTNEMAEKIYKDAHSHEGGVGVLEIVKANLAISGSKEEAMKELKERVEKSMRDLSRQMEGDNPRLVGMELNTLTESQSTSAQSLAVSLGSMRTARAIWSHTLSLGDREEPTAAPGFMGPIQPGTHPRDWEALMTRLQRQEAETTTLRELLNLQNRALADATRITTTPGGFRVGNLLVHRASFKVKSGKEQVVTVTLPGKVVRAEAVVSGMDLRYPTGQVAKVHQVQSQVKANEEIKHLANGPSEVSLRIHATLDDTDGRGGDCIVNVLLIGVIESKKEEERNDE